MTKIVLNSIDYRGSVVDGPGIRTVLFVQGCEARCRGCQNPTTWNIRKGKSVDIEDLVSELRNKSFSRKLTISGGEPLLQPQAVLELVQHLSDFEIALYTGFDFENVPRDILEHIRYVKVGRYVHERRSTVIPYVGSCNQKFIDLREQHA